MTGFDLKVPEDKAAFMAAVCEVECIKALKYRPWNNGADLITLRFPSRKAYSKAVEDVKVLARAYC